MKRKKNQTFENEAYSNLSSYLFYQKILKYFSFMTKVNPNNRNKTKN